MLNRNHENMPATYHFGRKILFDGYLKTIGCTEHKSLTINDLLFDGYLKKEKL